MCRFVESHPRLLSFLRERLSLHSYLGLHLTVGLAISAFFVWIAGGITEDVLTGDPFVAVDRWVLQRILYFRSPLATDVMLWTTQLGSPLIIVATPVVMAYLIWKKAFAQLIGYAVGMAGGSLLMAILKGVIRRPRPEVSSSLTSPWGWSFPSGHVMMSVIFYGLICYFFVTVVRSWRTRVLAVAIALFTIFMISFSRLYLQVHYLSDVLAGGAGGGFWLCVCITGLEIYRRDNRRKKGDHARSYRGR